MTESIDQTVRRVLLIDGDADAALLTSIQIERSPRFRLVGWAPDIEDGLRATAQLQPDVVLLDRRFPDGDGLEVLGELRATAPDAEFVLLTALPAFAIASAAAAHGVGFIDKLDLARLPKQLERALDRSVTDRRRARQATMQAA